MFERNVGDESRPRVVHVVQRMAPGGIETLVLDLVTRSGFRSYIFSRADELARGWQALSSASGMLIAFDRKPGLSPSLVGHMAARFRELKPHLVVAHHLGPLIYAGLAARLAGVPHLIHVDHDVWHYDNPRSRLLARAVAALSRPRHIAVCKSVALAMRKIFGWDDVAVVHPAIATPRFLPGDKNTARSRLGFDPRWKLVGTVGRLVHIKGHAVLVQALASLPNFVHLVIVGDGCELARLQAKAARLGVDGRLHFLGHRDDLEHVLPAFDVFCLPSLAEGLPRSVLEAQSCDLPVVASDVGGLSEVMCARTGTLVPPADPVALANALQQILREPLERGTTRKFVEREFSWSRTFHAYEGFLET